MNAWLRLGIGLLAMAGGLLYADKAASDIIVSRRRHRAVHDVHYHQCPCGHGWAHQARRDWTAQEAIAAHTCPSCNTEVWETVPVKSEPN